MFSTLRTRFGIPGVISVIALVFAMFGGAYAASNSSGGGKATASAKAKKGPRGPKGPKGDTGATGPQGPAGANGKDGANGTNGTNGTDGQDGAAGKSVVASAAAVPTECPTGTTGTKFQVEGSITSSHVCSGKDGKDGTFSTEPLPGGQTLTGVWGVEGGVAGDRQMAVISFPIPLEEAPTIAIAPPSFGGEWLEIKPDGTFVQREEKPGEEFTETCEGSPEAPTAPGGYLCVYASEEVGMNFNIFALTSEQQRIAPTQYGAHLPYTSAGTEKFAYGTWAVTAP